MNDFVIQKNDTDKTDNAGYQSLNYWPETPDEKLIKEFNRIDEIKKEMKELQIIAIDDNKKYPPRIKKTITHKKNASNVIISIPEKHGKIWYFNMIPETQEFNFDHPSDHIQGILILEVIRQCGIATTHLCGLSENGKIVLSNVKTTFNSYIKRSSPIIIRSLSRPVIFTKKYFKQYVLINIIQFGKICVQGTIEGIAFNNIEDYLTHEKKIENLIKKIHLKYNNQFQ